MPPTFRPRDAGTSAAVRVTWVSYLFLRQLAQLFLLQLNWDTRSWCLIHWLPITERYIVSQFFFTLLDTFCSVKVRVRTGAPSSKLSVTSILDLTLRPQLTVTSILDLTLRPRLVVTSILYLTLRPRLTVSHIN